MYDARGLHFGVSESVLKTLVRLKEVDCRSVPDFGDFSTNSINFIRSSWVANRQSPDSKVPEVDGTKTGPPQFSDRIVDSKEYTFYLIFLTFGENNPKPGCCLLGAQERRN